MDGMTMMTDMPSTTTATTSAAQATSTAMSMGGGMGGGNGCKISMLWNWNTIDACFVSSTWRIRSAGMFAGSCIGVILLTMSLELLRRLVKEYDRYLIRKRTIGTVIAASPNNSKESSEEGHASTATVLAPCATPLGFRPNVFEQAARALLHMVQFAVAYFIMLLAMYYNGYFIICIFIGAYLGAFIFQWETLGLGLTRAGSGNKRWAAYDYQGLNRKRSTSGVLKKMIYKILKHSNPVNFESFPDNLEKNGGKQNDSSVNG
ncbi:hypothetical protein DL767_005013 [Monosporascus sp. MG133]|nr:hypothetical protein DL767_005013 [Monosporascus sp. MG133]